MDAPHGELHRFRGLFADQLWICSFGLASRDRHVCPPYGFYSRNGEPSHDPDGRPETYSGNLVRKTKSFSTSKRGGTKPTNSRYFLSPEYVDRSGLCRNKTYPFGIRFG